ncbi:hypothetical protein [Streptomyces sp. NPDC054865]
MRAYASTGYLSPGVDLYGRRWWPCREITTRHEAGDQRAAASTSAVQALTDQLTTNPRPPPPSRPRTTASAPAPAPRRITATRPQVDTITAEGRHSVIT